ncbi:probable E3 ubiquitin-protein ligase BAH1-like 1 isoform X2 [Asparagus officinalis]|uniref:probable E3 ubiquitin-protein ligase BAH1-like 1 isoform X2 n=1 Tax=Asparagus officinalis TaxID=4686 RepID=UPI00098E2896|nr:probable E3 ubiquitin-protein ligase BAH1-like 1 isoform X2 [Asparagus officinalis]
MKFCKRYEEYMQGKEKELPGVGLKKLKKILKRCRREFQSGDHQMEPNPVDGGDSIARPKCPDQCPVCDGSFFPALLEEKSAVASCFNERAQKLLELHLTSGFRKYFKWSRSKKRRNHGVLIQEGRELVAYAIINSVAMRKILKKYDKIHYSKQGQAFRAQAQSLHIETLKSPWLCELLAFYINLREEDPNMKAIPGIFGNCLLTFDDERPILQCGLFDSVKLEVDLTCSLCLETVFDPVSLTCGHIFCYFCCCSSASVSIVDGLQSADHKAKCPLCRRGGVYEGVVRLEELNMLLRRRCPVYWEKRLRTERADRVHKAKEHWESMSRAFI